MTNVIAAAIAVPVEEYLDTAYHPDVDYVDGELEERNVGERAHGEMCSWIWLLLKRQKLAAYQETRLQVTPTRYRVPDVCAYEEKQTDQVLVQPPALCVEVLSPKDWMSRTLKVVREYLTMGTRVVWILDPLEKRAYIVDGSGLREVTATGVIDVHLKERQLVLHLDQIFGEEDIS